MKVAAYRGIVENGCVHLPAGVVLPDKTVVYVVVPSIFEIEAPLAPRICSPRLVHPDQAADFMKKEVAEKDP
jgi:hypothetical protein